MMDNNKLARSIISNGHTSLATLQKLVDHAKQSSDHTIHRYAQNTLTMRSRGWMRGKNSHWYVHKNHPGHEITIDDHEGSWSHLVKAKVRVASRNGMGGRINTILQTDSWLRVGTSNRSRRTRSHLAPEHTLHEPKAIDLEHHLDLLKKRGVLKGSND